MKTRDGFKILDWGSFGVFGGWVKISEDLPWTPIQDAYYDKFCNTLGPHIRTGEVAMEDSQ